MQGMKQAGWPLEVICPEGSEMETRALRAGFEVITWKKSSGISITLSRLIAREAKKYPSRILHAHDAQAHTAAVMANALFGARIPVVLSRRVDFPVAQSMTSAWKYNHPSIKAIACVSDAIADIVRASVKHTERVRTIHSGVDSSKFANCTRNGSLLLELQLPEETILIGNVAALADHKDYPTFLRTVNRLSIKNPHIHAVIAGTGPLESEIKALTKEMNLEKNVHFLGFRNDVAQLLPELDVFLFTSKTEGLGTSLIDALACGVPVVATRAGGIPEIIRHGENGFLAEVGDDAVLATFTETLLADTEIRGKHIQLGRETARQFSVDAMIQNTLQLYREISAQAGNSPL